ncbi:hypothetical protein FHS15_003435 [Paenibacillus castaneae]|nr:hypothetical protein [Paenibacillus castaneae]
MQQFRVPFFYHWPGGTDFYYRKKRCLRIDWIYYTIFLKFKRFNFNKIRDIGLISCLPVVLVRIYKGKPTLKVKGVKHFCEDYFY